MIEKLWRVLGWDQLTFVGAFLAGLKVGLTLVVLFWALTFLSHVIGGNQ